MDLSAVAAPLDALKPAPAAPTAGSAETRAKIVKTAHDFEASFLSVMLGQMFAGVSTDGTFGGGEGEAAFRSFLTDAMAKSMAAHGGIGLSKPLQAEMLKLQGLADPGAHA